MHRNCESVDLVTRISMKEIKDECSKDEEVEECEVEE